LHLAHPDEFMRQLLAVLMVVNEQDPPMSRLPGTPGVGKTTRAYAAGRRMAREVCIFQAALEGSVSIPA